MKRSDANKTIQPKTSLFKLATFLYFKGSVYKQDMLLYATKLVSGTQISPSKLLMTLKRRNIVELRDYTIGYRSQKRTTSVCFLTEKGRLILNRYFSDLTDVKIFDEMADRFRRKGYDKLLTLYNSNHIMTMFNCAGIQGDSVSKPSIKQLYCHINKVPYVHRDKRYKEMSYDVINRLYQEGIFYSAAEYKEFYKTLSGGEPLRSIFRGIYISKNKTLVIYSNGKNNNNLIYLPNEFSEHALTNSLIKNGLANGNISAITMSDANYFIYGTLAGRKFGLNKTALDKGVLDAKRNLERLELKEKCEKNNWNYMDRLAVLQSKWEKSDTYRENKSVGKNIIFGMNANINNSAVYGNYKMFYSVTFSQDGINALEYLVTHSDEEKYEEELEYVKNMPGLLRVSSFKDSIYPLEYLQGNTWIPCIYMPVYELHALQQMQRDEFTAAVITSGDMINTIQHCTHKVHSFIDCETEGVMIDEDAIIYDENGYCKGRKMLENYLLKKAMKAAPDQYISLPKKYDMSYAEFYNSIAKGEIMPEELMPLIETTEYDLREYGKRYYRKRKKTIAVSTDVYNLIKQYAVTNNITLYRAACNMIAGKD